MRFFSVLLSLMVFVNTHANFKKLAMEWDEQNIDIIEGRTQIELKNYDLERVNLQKTWNLSYEYDFSDSDKETSPASFINISSTSDTQTLSLSKDFDWGGKFSFNNYLTFTDYGTNSSLRVPKYYSFTQGVTYSQNLGADFFGRIYRQEQQVAQESVHLSRLEYNEKREQGLYNLLSQYTIASLTRSLINFQEEAKRRADKRLNLIQKWVRDGLRERVDLYQAQAAALAAEENVKLATIDLDKSLQQLGTALHRDVKMTEISPLAERKSVLEGGIFDVEDNKNLKVLQSRMEIYNKKLKQAENGIMPTILLTLGWNSNDFDVQRSNTFSNGRLATGNDEKTVTLSVSWPLGSLAKKAEKEQAAINMNLAKKKMDKYSKDIVEIRESLTNQIKTLEVNIKSIKNRITLNKKSLNEYNRLYNRGRANLDQVIGAEETLINSEISLIRQQAELEQKSGELGYLNGTLINTVMKD